MIANSAESEMDSETQRALKSSTIAKNQELASKALLYYPEEMHSPSEEACSDFNARIMRHLMKSKMQKNDTFYVAKVLKGNNNFLRRDN